MFLIHTYTGKGWVKEHRGTYHDSLHVKNNTVVILLVASGAIGRVAARELRRASRRANKKNGRDGTKYSRIYRTPFLAHHMRAISGAAVFSDAAHIEGGVNKVLKATYESIKKDRALADSAQSQSDDE